MFSMPFPSRVDWKEQMWGTSPYKYTQEKEHWTLHYNSNPRVLWAQQTASHAKQQQCEWSAVRAAVSDDRRHQSVTDHAKSQLTIGVLNDFSVLLCSGDAAAAVDEALWMLCAELGFATFFDHSELQISDASCSDSKNGAVGSVVGP